MTPTPDAQCSRWYAVTPQKSSFLSCDNFLSHPQVHEGYFLIQLAAEGGWFIIISQNRINEQMHMSRKQ